MAKALTIVVTGGGSGGHITPILAVAAELKKLNPLVRIIYIGQRGDALSDVPARDPSIDVAYSVRAGKFRRYHGHGLKQVLDLPTVAKNLRDAAYALIGIGQSYQLLRRLQPTIIFIKGGFVGVPVGLAAALRHIPYITHDSDAMPGLANRIIAHWARRHAVALPAEVYPYPSHKTTTVGIPVTDKYQLVTPDLERLYRRELGLEQYEQILFVTGGGNGARQLNREVVANAAYLLKRYPRLALVHVAGRALENETAALYKKAVPASDLARIILKGFVTDLYRYSGAANVIVGRGSATNLAEFALQAKPCVIVPASHLVWTIRNAEVLAGAGAIRQMTEAQAEQERRLGLTISELLDQPALARQLATKLHTFARPQAARDLAVLLLEEATK